MKKIIITLLMILGKNFDTKPVIKVKKEKQEQRYKAIFITLNGDIRSENFSIHLQDKRGIIWFLTGYHLPAENGKYNNVIRASREIRREILKTDKFLRKLPWFLVHKDCKYPIK